MKKRQAVLDTSFWSLTVHLSLQGYLDDLFKTPVYVPPEVEDEILSRENAPPGRIYPDQKEYEIYSDAGRLEGRAPDEALEELGAGESEAISLADELDIAILINESTGYRIAKEEHDVFAIHIPLYIFLLCYDDIISEEKALRCLEDAKAVTPDSFIDNVVQLIEELPGGQSQ